MSPRKKRAAKSKVYLTARAVSDLREVEEYSISVWGSKVADRYLDEIDQAVGRLAVTPGLLRLEPEFSTGLYFYRVRKHFLVCDQRESIILVLSIVHTSMDLPTRIAELEPRLVVEASLMHQQLRKG